MKIVNATPHDVDVIFDLYDKAIEFQKTLFVAGLPKVRIISNGFTNRS